MLSSPPAGMLCSIAAAHSILGATFPLLSQTSTTQPSLLPMWLQITLASSPLIIAAGTGIRTWLDVVKHRAEMERLLLDIQERKLKVQQLLMQLADAELEQKQKRTEELDRELKDAIEQPIIVIESWRRNLLPDRQAPTDRQAPPPACAFPHAPSQYSSSPSLLMLMVIIGVLSYITFGSIPMLLIGAIVLVASLFIAMAIRRSWEEKRDHQQLVIRALHIVRNHLGEFIRESEPIRSRRN